MMDIVESLSIRHRKMLAGNSMHLVTQGSWMTYCLSNIIRKQPCKKVPRPLGSSSQEDLSLVAMGDGDDDDWAA
jgi:hypothetical protein